MHSFLVKSKAFGFVLFCLASAIIAGFSTEAAAATLDFENVAADSTPIPDGYGGLHWTNFDASFDDGGYFPASGYYTGLVSGDWTAFNDFALPADISSDTTFDLISGYFTAAWRNGLSIEATGYRNGVQLYSTTFTVDVAGPYLQVFNWLNVDDVHFESFGGVIAGVGGQGTNFVLDNLQVAQTPIPSSLLMLGTALTGLLYAGRKRMIAA